MFVATNGVISLVLFSVAIAFEVIRVPENPFVVVCYVREITGKQSLKSIAKLDCLSVCWFCFSFV